MRRIVTSGTVVGWTTGTVSSTGSGFARTGGGAAGLLEARDAAGRVLPRSFGSESAARAADAILGDVDRDSEAVSAAEPDDEAVRSRDGDGDEPADATDPAVPPDAWAAFVGRTTALDGSGRGEAADRALAVGVGVGVIGDSGVAEFAREGPEGAAADEATSIGSAADRGVAAAATGPAPALDSIALGRGRGRGRGRSPDSALARAVGVVPFAEATRSTRAAGAAGAAEAAIAEFEAGDA